ncbi:MAG TPA: HNH endonuclease [Anaerolineae bacterium]|nr:HNH endonuclease [Anaerolineae bacterium]
MSRVYIPKKLRERVAAQAKHRCGYCLTAESIVGTPMEIDHIIPLSLGGLTEEDNLWLACSLCNNHKGNRIAMVDPFTGESAPLFNPRRQVWREHFSWTQAGDRIIGLTVTGRVTVIALNLNRPSLVVSRQAWATVGWHPPND